MKERLIRKIDYEGNDFVGKLHSSDVSFEMGRSREILQKERMSLLFFGDGSYERRLEATLNVASGEDYVLPYSNEGVRSKGIRPVADADGKNYLVNFEGLYFIGAQVSCNTPIDGKHSETNLKLQVNSAIYLLDSQPLAVTLVPTGSGYLHFTFLQGWRAVYLKRGDRFKFLFSHVSDAIPPANLNTNFSGWMCTRFLGDGWQE